MAGYKLYLNGYVEETGTNTEKKCMECQMYGKCGMQDVAPRCALYQKGNSGMIMVSERRLINFIINPYPWAYYQGQVGLINGVINYLKDTE